jgi:hypothetical protein
LMNWSSRVTMSRPISDPGMSSTLLGKGAGAVSRAAGAAVASGPKPEQDKKRDDR